ncbi:RING finger protein 207 [Amphibalanus amphitrite]|uniref:RING finger protein 207 n=1 Tax=Amphibalanus amphitrite TaxID=1232801 RepID=A0A6A4VLB5_AMPAM|nr:RING finger protein 207 [Amphibalanus amphitrite]
MAGGILSSSVDDLLPSSVDDLCRNPLICPLCNQVYEEPCLLVCFHSFCAKCLRVRVVDGRVACTVCSKTTVLKDGNSLPPADVLLRFLVEFSTEARTPCANCETTENISMFFCNTCGQALCERCKNETHRAKMFSMHEVMSLSERLRKACKQCPVHNEPHIMFSTDKKELLCINCFREYSTESKLHCVDLDTAYTDGVRRLERNRRVSASCRTRCADGIILYRALLDEVRHNMEAEKTAVTTFCRQLHETVSQLQSRLLSDVEGQYTQKTCTFQQQLCDLCSLLPVLHVHLSMCTTFTHSANKTEFLDLSYSLMGRLSNIAHIGVPLRPSQTSQVKTNYRREVCQALDPLLCPPAAATPEPGGRLVPVAARRAHTANRLRLLDSSGPFADHCRAIETRLQEITGRYRQLREMSPDRAEVACQVVDGDIVSLACEVEEARLRLQHRWDEVSTRLQMERDVFSAQVSDLQQLRADLNRFTIAIKQQTGDRPNSSDTLTNSHGAAGTAAAAAAAACKKQRATSRERPEVPPRVDSLPCQPPASGQRSGDESATSAGTGSGQPDLHWHQQAGGDGARPAGRGAAPPVSEAQRGVMSQLREVVRRGRERSEERWREPSPPPANWRDHSEERWRSDDEPPLDRERRMTPKLTWSSRGDGPPLAASTHEQSGWRSSASWPRRKAPVLTPISPREVNTDYSAGSMTSIDSQPSEGASHPSGFTSIDSALDRTVERVITGIEKSAARARGRAPRRSLGDQVCKFGRFSVAKVSRDSSGHDTAIKISGRVGEVRGAAAGAPAGERRLLRRGRPKPRSRDEPNSSPTDDERRHAYSDSESKAGRRTRRGPAVRRQKSADSCDGRSRALLAAEAAAVRRTDSFEGHEQTVQTIVAAVQESRTARRRNK